MSEEEHIVLKFLQEFPESAFNRREISRKAVNRRFYEANPHWADTALASLVAQKLITTDASGNYRIPKLSVDDL